MKHVIRDTSNKQNHNANNNSVQTNENNWAFIDMQNLHKGVQERGWRINWQCFRKFLGDKINVTRAIVFMGYIPEYRGLYNLISAAGFDLEFREVRKLKDGTVEGGNVDADLASYVMDFKNDYYKAVVVADDGDYCRTIQSLNRQNKLKLIISSHALRHTSELIKRVVRYEQILSIHSIRNLIE